MNIEGLIYDGYNFITVNNLNKINKVSIISIIINRRGNIISVGLNSYSKTHPVQAEFSKRAWKKGVVENGEQVFLHAEIASLVRCRKKPHAMIIVRVDKKDQFANCKPCPICQLAIKEAKIDFKNVYYTTGDNNGYETLE